jgi:hypothetical protein
VTPHETNGRIKLTWAQIVWAVSMFIMLAGMWGRMEVRTALIEAKLEGKASVADVEKVSNQLRFHVSGVRFAPDAQAEPKH